MYYASRLAKMIQCKTVSKKDEFEETEFLKLRKVIQELFPLVSEKAELLIFLTMPIYINSKEKMKIAM